MGIPSRAFSSVAVPEATERAGDFNLRGWVVRFPLDVLETLFTRFPGADAPVECHVAVAAAARLYRAGHL